MESLSLVVSVSSRRTIKSRYITDPVLLSPFSLGDTINGRIAVVSETNDPTAPTTGVPVTGSTNIAITDGASVIYSAATGITVENGNELVFTLSVSGTGLVAAMTGAYVQAFLEVRATISGQDELIAKEPVVVTNAAT
jgi:hypothetical protein